MKVSYYFIAIAIFILGSTTIFAQHDEGHFKFGLINVEGTDSLSTDAVMKNMIYQMFSKKSRYDLYFNQQKSVTVVRMEEKLKRVVYDDKSLLSYTFLEIGKHKYYSVDSSVLLLKAQHEKWKAENVNAETEAQKAIDTVGQLIKISHATEDMKTIFGFQCLKCEIRNPNELDKVFSVIYTTDKIPIPDEGFGELAEFFPGCALESSLFLQGMKVTMGAVSFEPETGDPKIFTVNTKKYKKVNAEELDALMNE